MQILEHIHLNVNSLRDTERFLQAALPGFRSRGAGEAPGYGSWLHIGNDSNYIALTEVKGAQPMQHLRHIGLVVENIDELVQRLNSAGFEPRDSSALDEHPHRKRIYYRDGNGLDWEFIEYLEEKPALRNDYSL